MLQQLRAAADFVTRPFKIVAAHATAAVAQPGSPRHTNASEKLFDLAMGTNNPDKRLKLVRAHLKQFDRELAARFPTLPATASAFAPPRKLDR